MPAQAFRLKKYFGGINPSSNTSGNEEHTAPSLGNSEMPRVKDSPSDLSLGSNNHTSVRPPFPRWWNEGGIGANQGAEETAERVVLDGEDARHVFPEDKLRVDFIYCLHKGQGEIASLVRKRFAPAGGGKRLAGRTARHQVHLAPILPPVVTGDVADVGNAGMPVRKDGGGERSDLGKADRLPPDAGGFDREAHAFDAGKHGNVSQGHAIGPSTATL